MKKFRAAILSLLVVASAFAALPAKAASSPLPAPPQGNCDENLSKGEGKFTGQISGGPNGSLIEITSGNETAIVRYSPSSVLVCEGRQIVSINVLATGSTVMVVGPVKRKGKVTEITAVKIFVAASSQTGSQSSDELNTNYSANARGRAGSANSNADSGASQTSNQDSTQMGSVAGSKDHPNSLNSGAVSCDELLFGVTNPRDPNSGQATQRASASAIVCKRPVDQLALQLSQDAMERRGFSIVRLKWQNQLEASLKNAEILSVQFASDNGMEIVEITYSCQTAEIAHLPSGTKISF